MLIFPCSILLDSSFGKFGRIWINSCVWLVKPTPQIMCVSLTLCLGVLVWVISSKAHSRQDNTNLWNSCSSWWLEVNWLVFVFPQKHSMSDQWTMHNLSAVILSLPWKLYTPAGLDLFHLNCILPNISHITSTQVRTHIVLRWMSMRHCCVVAEPMNVTKQVCTDFSIHGMCGWGWHFLQHLAGKLISHQYTSNDGFLSRSSL